MAGRRTRAGTPQPVRGAPAHATLHSERSVPWTGEVQLPSDHAAEGCVHSVLFHSGDWDGRTNDRGKEGKKEGTGSIPFCSVPTRFDHFVFTILFRMDFLFESFYTQTQAGSNQPKLGTSPGSAILSIPTSFVGGAARLTRTADSSCERLKSNGYLKNVGDYHVILIGILNAPNDSTWSGLDPLLTKKQGIVARNHRLQACH